MNGIEYQIICKILGNPECFRTYIDNNIDSSYFVVMEEEFKFIHEHYKKYRVVPSIPTFFDKFPDMDYIEIHEPDRFLIEDLKEEYLYKEGKRIFVEGAKKLEGYSFEGLEYILAKSKALLETNTFTEGTNLRNLRNNKLDDIERRSNSSDGLIGIPSGFDELDARLFGWQSKEELVSIVARTNQGKSWILQRFLMHANKLGKRVLLYSGEMSATQVSYRYDTMRWNYSNSSFMKGDMTERDLTSYDSDLLEFENNGTDYIVIEPKDIGNKLLTVSRLKSLIEKYKPDIVGIDQLSFMEDERKTNSTSKREQFGNITIDLFNTTSEYNVPILLAVQANRDSAKGGVLTVPGLTDIGESDLVGQNSSRVISFVQTEPGLIEMEVPKNRYGAKDFTLHYKWNIDVGQFEYTEELEGIEGGLAPKGAKRRPDSDSDSSMNF